MKVLVAGSCHADVVGRAVDLAGEISGHRIEQRVWARGPSSEDLVDFARTCDVLVLQIDQRGSNDDLVAAIPKNALKITFPILGMNWLWPFATQPHPSNRHHPPYLESGAFPGDHSDALFNRLLRKHPDPNIALAEFRRLDPTEHTDLDRVFEFSRERMLSIEENTDVRVWHLIENGFRRKRLFWSPGHPTWELFEQVCRDILRRLPLALKPSHLDSIAGRIGAYPPWATMQAPIHPRVAEHFALQWHYPGMHYQQGDAGWFTYDEHMERYARFYVDLDAYRGAHLTKKGQTLDVAERLLRGAMVRAPRNRELDYLLALNLWKQRRPEAARPFAARAARDSHASASHRVHHLHYSILWKLGRFEDVVTASEEALWTHYPAEHYYVLGRALAKLSRREEAAAAFRMAAAGDPHNLTYQRDLAETLTRAAPADTVRMPVLPPSLYAPAAASMHQQGAA